VLHFSPRSPSGAVFLTIERVLAGRTDATIFESAFAKRTYERQITAPRGPALVVHNGVTEGEFAPVSPDPDAADFVFVGELRTLKGIFVLVEALAALPRSATLVMAGDGPERGALEARIAALGLGARVMLTGAQPARGMFARGRCIVVPSLAESLPYIVLEAAAARLPMIATNVGGIPEIFGETAASLVPPADAGALAARMASFLGDTASAEKEAGLRREIVRAGFSVTVMTDKIEAVYRQALATRRGVPSI
jgi:glycosyltransferase involved in cell wall biosynthesis